MITDQIQRREFKKIYRKKDQLADITEWKSSGLRKIETDTSIVLVPTTSSGTSEDTSYNVIYVITSRL